jgi:hypothetical protein
MSPGSMKQTPSQPAIASASIQQLDFADTQIRNGNANQVQKSLGV